MRRNAFDDLGHDLDGEDHEADEHHGAKRPHDWVPSTRAGALAGADSVLQVDQQPPGNDDHGGQDNQRQPDQVDIGQAWPRSLVVEEVDAHMGVGRHRIGDGQHERAAHQERVQIVAPARRCVEGVAQQDVVEHEHDQQEDQSGGQHAAEVADPIDGTNQGAHARLIPQNCVSAPPHRGSTDDRCALARACPIYAARPLTMGGAGAVTVQAAI